MKNRNSSSPQKTSSRKFSSSSFNSQTSPVPGKFDPDQISPELVPIVTLLSAQTHRRYHEGTFMLYNDLNGDGNPADREWKEVYGILTGNQLAYWDAANLARFRNSPEKLFQTSSKPNYLNFTDAVFNAMKVLPAAKMQLENVLIVSTTLKNRYIIQLRTFDQLKEWNSALRLATYEYQSLQEAYTGALLSARGSMLSDIRTILAPKRFNHEDWVKIRYGSGMAWKRCYAVIEPSQSKKKHFTPGRVLLYESDNLKKKALVGVITSATSVTAVYPQSPFFIDKSTIMKLEGRINFKSPTVKPSKKSNADSQDTSLFLMPEQHSAVPGFDTLIRFLIPLYDTFGLYGRPERLKADRVDPDSLVFGLPTLPHVHYLNSSDLKPLISSVSFMSWDARAWTENIKNVLKMKMARGYDGCGSTRGLNGAVSSLNSPRLGPSTIPRASASPSTPQSATAPPNGSRSVSGSVPSPSGPRENVAEKRAASAGAPPRLGPSYANVPQANGTYPNGHANGSSTSVSHANGSYANGSYANGASHSGSLPNGSYSSGSHPGVPREQLPTSTLKASKPSNSSRNVNNLELRTSPVSRGSTQLSDIYQKYSTIETPSDKFNDRNMILNGSPEEIDEEVLPTLMRKKSLKHGPYPTSDRHLIDSESEESDEDESTEDDFRSSGSFVRGPGKESLLAVPSGYEDRNLSNSSVHSPLTQYNEFNQQFSKSVDHNAGAKYPINNSDAESEISVESDFLLGSSPPTVPHGLYQRSPISPVVTAQQLPQIQQLQSLHSAKQYTTEPLTPSSGEKFDTEQLLNYSSSVRQDTAVQKSKATRNLSQTLDAPVDGYNKPRYIKSPAPSQNQSPRDFGMSSGAFTSASSEADRRNVPVQNAKIQQLSQQYAIQSQPSAYNQPQSQVQSQPQQQPQQYNQGHSVQRPQQQPQPVQKRPQQPQQFQQGPPQPQPHSQKPQHPQQSYRPLVSSQQAPIAMQPNQRPPQQGPQQYPPPQQRGPPPQQYYEQNKPGGPQVAQQYQTMPRKTSAELSYGQPQSSSGRPAYGGFPQQSQPPQQSNGYHQPHQQKMQSQPRPPQGQGYPVPRQAAQQKSHAMQARPQAQPSQSASNIRSYGEQQYQYQVQPNFQPSSRQQQQYQAPMQMPNDPKLDPRLQPQPANSEYMRQY